MKMHPQHICKSLACVSVCVCVSVEGAGGWRNGWRGIGVEKKKKA